MRAVLRAIALLVVLAASPAIAKPPQQLFESISPSIVVVVAANAEGKPTGQGSGVVIERGAVATNCHVVERAARIVVRHKKREYPATVRWSDWDRDLCQIAVPGLKAPPVAMGSVKALKVGSRVYAIGAPEGLELTLSEGLVSGLREAGDGYQIIQTTAPISPGSSGGGLFDEEGRLVGLTTFYLLRGQNLNFALPVEWLKELPGRAVARPPAKESLLVWLRGAGKLEEAQNWKTLLEYTRRWVRAQPQEFLA